MEELQKLAEAQMRRKAPERAVHLPSKRQKLDDKASLINPVTASATANGASAGGSASIQTAEADADDISEPLRRFDYSPLQPGDSGFLIHCNFKREKSATREAMTALAPFLHTMSAISGPVTNESIPIDRVGVVPVTLEGGDDGTAEGDSTRAGSPPDAETELRKDNAVEMNKGEGEGTTVEDLAVDQGIGSAAAKSAAVEGDGGSLSSCVAPAGSLGEAVVQLSVVKVGCSGLVMLRSKAGGANCVAAVGRLLDAVAAGSVPHLRHCHRIIPVEIACLLTEGGLTEAAGKLCRSFAEGLGFERRKQPITFGVSYKSRGTPDAAPPTSGPPLPDSNPDRPVNRSRLLSIVAAAMSDACTAAGCADVKVDLKGPQYGVMVEGVPASGGDAWCVMAVVPSSMLALKPRLTLHTLISSKR